MTTLKRINGCVLHGGEVYEIRLMVLDDYGVADGAVVDCDMFTELSAASAALAAAQDAIAAALRAAVMLGVDRQ